MVTVCRDDRYHTKGREEMKARFSFLPDKIDLRKENMALLAASILVSIMKTEDAEHIRIRTEDETFKFRKVNK